MALGAPGTSLMHFDAKIWIHEGPWVTDTPATGTKPRCGALAKQQVSSYETL
jgi:hypothetical protein